MSEDQAAAAPDLDTETLKAELDKANRKAAAAEESVRKLEQKRTEALDETKRLKRVAKLIEAAGLDPNDPESEGALAERLIAKPVEPAIAPAASEQTAPATSTEDIAARDEIKRMRKQLEAMEAKAKKAEEEAEAAKQRTVNDRIEREFTEALRRAGCRRPTHVYKLNKDELRMSEDGSVLCGPEWEPRMLTAFIETLKEDDDWAIYFEGSGATGSGAGVRSGSQGGGLGGKNPFATGTVNATEAARMFQENPQRAKTLMAEAQSAGKLDPIMSRAFNR
jgi:hypothetical protein